MSNPFYTRQTTLAPGDLARASDINSELDAVVTGFDNINVTFNLAIGLPESFSGNRTIPVQTYANKFVYINSDGNCDLYEVANLVNYETEANNAAASAVLAGEYANKAEDAEVVPGEYSAKHWAAKAELVLLNGAASVGYTPTGDLVATTVAGALDELEAEKAVRADTVLKADPQITGTPTESEYVGPTSGAVTIQVANGPRQFFTLTGAVTFTDDLADGQAVLVGVDNGPGDEDITWPAGIVWLTDEGFAPYINPTGFTFVIFLHAQGQLYGARVGTN